MCYPEASSILARSEDKRLGWQCFALEVEDMDAALGMLKADGVQPTWGPVKRPDYARAEIRDPDGIPSSCDRGIGRLPAAGCRLIKALPSCDRPPVPWRPCLAGHG